MQLVAQLKYNLMCENIMLQFMYSIVQLSINFIKLFIVLSLPEPLNHILSKMEECIAQPRDRKDNWPCTGWCATS